MRVAFALVPYPNVLDRRGAERAAAILAAKHASLGLNDAWALEELAVVRRENASPLLRVAGRDVGVRLSVAHGDGLAVAAACIR
jgi:hypothetical protein